MERQCEWQGCAHKGAFLVEFTSGIGPKRYFLCSEHFRKADEVKDKLFKEYG